jgi:hypothetical protein
MSRDTRDPDPEESQQRPRVSWKIVTIGLLAVLLVSLGSLTYIGFQRAEQVQAEYQAAVTQVEAINSVANSDDIYALSSDDMTWLKDEFMVLEHRIDEIEELASLPLGIDSVLARLPWVEPRYNAGMETLELGRILAQAGGAIADVGEDAIHALDERGVRHDPSNDGDTWLDVIHAREFELTAALEQIDDAMVLRQQIQREYLPDRVVARLDQMDDVMDRFSEQLELADQLDLAYGALGAEEPVRYLLLFQNPAELRPTGGFVGTVAQLEVHRGQISMYEFHDVYELTLEYQAQDDFSVDPPWAIREYIRPDDLQIQDANWWSNFPTSASLLMGMTEAAGWGRFDGVVAVQPETIQQLMTVTGPITVEVDGQPREITSENLPEEAERQRRIQREGEEAETQHKEVIELISEILIDELADGGRDAVIDAVFLLFDQLDVRDMQVYHADRDVQEFVEERNWAGLDEPISDTPTLSVIFANITGLKTSLAMQADAELEILESSTDELMEGILTVGLGHLGAETGDPFYEGFQRWWVDLRLPGDANVIESIPDPSEDPDASNAGAYVVDLDVNDREEISVRFSAPWVDTLLVRRQPGLVPMQVRVTQNDCDEPTEFEVTMDFELVLETGSCPVARPVFDVEGDAIQ